MHQHNQQMKVNKKMCNSTNTKFNMGWDQGGNVQTDHF